MQSAPERPLGTVAATALVVASMIGTGIFTTSGYLSGLLGSPLAVLAVWVVGGLLALCGAAVYAELGAMMPRAGGEYVYLSRAFGPATGFLSGWISLVVGFAAPIAASAYAFGAYVHAVAPAVPPVWAAVALVAAMTALHMVDVTWGARVQTALSAFKVLIIVAFVTAAALVGDGDTANLVEPPLTGGAEELAVALVLVSFAYSGWNAAAYVAGELREPARSLPRSLLLGTGAVLALYVALNLAFFYGAGSVALAASPEDVGDVAARALFGDAGAGFSVAIALALVSSVSAMVFAGPRVYLAMAQDGLLFGALARRNVRGAPWASVALQGALATALILTTTFEDLLTWIGFTLSVFAALTVLGAFVLRLRDPAARPYRAMGWPLTPLLFLGLSVWMVIFSVRARPEIALAGGATLAAGLIVYLVRRRLW
ncbi:MAG: amino acid permease [Myxococcales bacterium]